jgi:hypothetical protein
MVPPAELKRSIPGLPDPLAVTMRLAVLVFMVAGLVEAQHPHAAGQWWSSRWYWAVLAALVAATAAIAWRARERVHRRRQRALASAVKERTADLERERHSERERNRILEMLVSNEPLESVLEEVLQGIRSQCPGALCAILLKGADNCQVLAALDVPGEWLTALRVARAVPFEAWRMPLSGQHPSTDPAWSVFASRLKGPAPGTVSSRPIRNGESPPGVILLFYEEAAVPGEFDAIAAEIGERMARLAIEQNRLYDSLHFQACHDGLTGLPNRALFEERLDRYLREAETLGKRLAVLFVDVDRFKRVNDTFSHRVGDLYLCEIANRMKQTLRPIDTVARVG